MPTTSGVRVRTKDVIDAVFLFKIEYENRVTAYTRIRPLIKVKSPMA